MSRRTAKDYRKVLKAVKRMMGSGPQAFCVDFEAGLWKAIRKTFPDVPIQGCAFHWTQAVWRKIQNLGLGTKYLEKTTTYKYCQKLLTLPLLPAEHIRPTFDFIAERVTDQLRPLTDYVEQTWITSATFPPFSWSVFGQSVRTNNDVEGWHRRFNDIVRGTPPFYLLLKELHAEAGHIQLTAKLLSEVKVKRAQRKHYRDLQGKIFNAWERYSAGDMSASRLLKKLSKVYRPTP